MNKLFDLSGKIALVTGGSRGLGLQMARALGEAGAKPVSLVTRAVRHAIESAKPRTRYPLDWSWYAGRWLPDRGFDQLIFKAFGITRLMQRFSK